MNNVYIALLMSFAMHWDCIAYDKHSCAMHWDFIAYDKHVEQCIVVYDKHGKAMQRDCNAYDKHVVLCIAIKMFMISMVMQCIGIAMLMNCKVV